MRRSGLISLNQTVFFLCDIQERFRPLIFNMPTVINTAKLMVEAGNSLSVPIIATEQYSRVFGHTVSEIPLESGNSEHKVPVFEKRKFSMLTPELDPVFTVLERPSVVLFGIEAHVCILQTCLDLLDRGIDVHLVCDGISSQRKYDRAVALERMKSCGAFLTTAESILFQLLGDSSDPRFKQISSLIKNHNELLNEFASQDAI